jgi:hypothetical protein
MSRRRREVVAAGEAERRRRVLDRPGRAVRDPSVRRRVVDDDAAGIVVRFPARSVAPTASVCVPSPTPRLSHVAVPVTVAAGGAGISVVPRLRASALRITLVT